MDHRRAWEVLSSPSAVFCPESESKIVGVANPNTTSRITARLSFEAEFFHEIPDTSEEDVHVFTYDEAATSSLFADPNEQQMI